MNETAKPANDQYIKFHTVHLSYEKDWPALKQSGG